MSEQPTVAEPAVSGSGQMAVIELIGEVRLRASVSMLFTDLLSQELNAALSMPDSVDLLQKHLQNRQMDQLTQREIQPLLESVPESIIDIAKEAVFSAGALVKRIGCEMQVAIGDGFIFRGSGLMAELEIKDGRVVDIHPLLKR